MALPISIGIFGAALGTGNRGVDALALSTVDGILGQLPEAQITLFDYGRGRRREILNAKGESFWREGWYYSRRFYRPSNLAQMLVASNLGLNRIHPNLRKFSQFDAILDISGGDSFSDIYGNRRFVEITAPKKLAISTHVPLILLPQTYGPYQSESTQKEAGRILRNARSVWSRDEASHRIVETLLGSEFDPTRHRHTYDVAFRLPTTKPSCQEAVENVLRVKNRTPTLVGLNVSGLLFNDESQAMDAFGLLHSYRVLISELIDSLLQHPNLEILLVPHVVDPKGGPDCDAVAIRKLHSSLPPAEKSRVTVVSSNLNASEVKWIIGQTDWFCGSRMHSCIASLSQCIPTAAVAYSDKTLGVFSSVGVADAVVDPRRIAKKEVIDELLRLFEHRENDRLVLENKIPEAKESLEFVFEQLASELLPS